MRTNLGSAGGETDPAFIDSACAWVRDPAPMLLSFVWKGFDAMKAACPLIETKDLERSITQLLEPRVRDVMSGYEPFYVQKECYEHETMAAPPAQPPAYDLAFVLRADERIKWPLEAKVIETPGTLADYVNDICREYLTCRYAPFSGSGAMLAYLLSGTAADTFDNIANRLRCALEETSEFSDRPHRTSNHRRTVPPGKSYPIEFTCHHMVLEFIGLERARTSNPDKT